MENFAKAELLFKEALPFSSYLVRNTLASRKEEHSGSFSPKRHINKDGDQGKPSKEGRLRRRVSQTFPVSRDPYSVSQDRQALLFETEDIRKSGPWPSLAASVVFIFLTPSPNNGQVRTAVTAPASEGCYGN